MKKRKLGNRLKIVLKHRMVGKKKKKKILDGRRGVPFIGIREDCGNGSTRLYTRNSKAFIHAGKTNSEVQ